MGVFGSQKSAFGHYRISDTINITAVPPNTTKGICGTEATTRRGACCAARLGSVATVEQMLPHCDIFAGATTTQLTFSFMSLADGRNQLHTGKTTQTRASSRCPMQLRLCERGGDQNRRALLQQPILPRASPTRGFILITGGHPRLRLQEEHPGARRLVGLGLVLRLMDHRFLQHVQQGCHREPRQALHL